MPPHHGIRTAGQGQTPPDLLCQPHKTTIDTVMPGGAGLHLNLLRLD